MTTRPPKIAPRSKRAPLSRSEIMSRIRAQDTRPEVLVRAAVHKLGYRFRKHVRDLPGKPDIANKTAKWAIFVHGCFWHSHADCTLASSPKTNSTYWAPKLAGNKARDAQKIASLRAQGYRVFVIWECDVRAGRHLSGDLAKFLRASRRS